VLVHIVTHRRTYDPRVSRDWRSLAEDGIDSAVESEKTSERVRRAVAALAVEGTPTGRIPYGYQRRYDPITRKLVKQEPDPDEAPIVREIIGRVARGDAVSVITADLNARGVRASEGGQWTRGMVRKVAGSPTYVARRVHRGQVYDGKWPALVSETEWAAARRVLGDRARTTTRPGRARWLLSYLAQCSVCETRLQTHPARSGRHACYACPHGHTTVNMDALDAVVIDAVVTRLADPAEVAELMAADDAAAVAAGEEAVALRARLADHYDEAADGKLSAAGLAAVEARLLTRIEDADQRAQVAAVPMQLRELVAVGDDRKDAVLDRWTALPLSSQRGILRELFARLAVAPLGRVGRRGDSDPEVVESRVSFESSEETPRWRQPGRSSAPFFA
jgi:hypothetical protein